MLAFAGALAVGEGAEDGDGGVQPGQDVGERDARLLRPAARQRVALAGHRHQPAHALDHEVVAGALGVRAGLAEAGDRAVDQARIGLRQALVVEAVFLQPADLVVLDQNVGLLRQLDDERAAPLACDVDGDRLLAPVGGHEIGALAGRRPVRDEGRAPAARVVAAAGPLDLDDVGAHVGQCLRRPGAGQDAGEIEHAQMRQRGGHDRETPSFLNVCPASLHHEEQRASPGHSPGIAMRPMTWRENIIPGR